MKSMNTKEKTLNQIQPAKALLAKKSAVLAIKKSYSATGNHFSGLKTAFIGYNGTTVYLYLCEESKVSDPFIKVSAGYFLLCTSFS